MDDTTTTIAEPTADTGAADTAANPTSAASETVSASAGAADQAATPTTSDAAAAAARSSSATDTRSASPTIPAPGANPQATAQAIDWEKRYREQEKLIGRHSRELGEARRSLQAWEGLDPQRVRALLQQQEQQAAQQQLKPWHPRHPEAQRTESRLHAVRAFLANRDVIRSRTDLDENVRRGLLEDLAARSGLTDSDVQLYRDHERHVQDQHASFARDPQAFIAEHVTSIVQQQLREYDNYVRAHATTHAWLNDPQNAPLIEKHRDLIAQALDENVPRRDLGLHLAQLTAQVDALKAKLGEDRATVETAKAQSAALKTRATVTRDASGEAQTKDPLDEAREKGLILDHESLVAHLTKARARQA